MFEGFSPRAEEFFMAIAFNNNTTFFHENHDWYDEAVRRPLKELAASLAPVIEKIDPNLERRPERVVSRINRDVRFSKDKSPYRDYMWLSFRAPRETQSLSLCFYFEISASGASCGMGVYDENRPLMNGLRRRLIADPAPFLEIARPLDERFSLHANLFRRRKAPDDLPDEAKSWFLTRSFFYERPLDGALIESPRLAEETGAAFKALSPLYRYLSAIEPVEADVL